MDDFDELLGVNAPVVDEAEILEEIKSEKKKKPKAKKPMESQAVNLIQKDLSKVDAPVPVKGTHELSRERTAKLLSSLGVDLGVKLNKNDTAEILAYVMSANEATLESLVQSKRIPLAIKTVIRSLQADANKGSLDTLQFLWRRVFGSSPLVEESKSDVALSMTETTGVHQGLPVVSREALLVLRDVSNAMRKESGNDVS